MYESEFKGFSGGGSQFASILKMAPSPGNYQKSNTPQVVKNFIWSPDDPANRGGYIPNPQKKQMGVRDSYGRKIAYEDGYSDYTNPRSARYNPMYSRRSKIKIPSFKLPAMGGLLNIALIGGAVYIGYKLITSIGSGVSSITSLFSPSPQTTAVDAGNAALAKTFVSDAQAQANTLTATASSLGSSGLSVSQLHRGIADTLHGMLNSQSPDQAEIVAIIKQQSIPTFQLVSVAYGTRDLNVWWDNHPFQANFWSPLEWIGSHHDTGTLYGHLTMILSDSSQGEISQYLSAIA